MNHGLMMLIGCGIPMLLLFILPGLGVSKEVTNIIFVVLMVACHMMHFSHGRHDEHSSCGHDEEGDDERD